MQPASADAFVAGLSRTKQIAALAVLYDRFAHAIDPFAPGRDEAEQAFMFEVASPGMMV
jgi:hypothetical protein